MGLTFVPVTLIATTNVSAEDAGLASGLFNLAAAAARSASPSWRRWPRTRPRA